MCLTGYELVGDLATLESSGKCSIVIEGRIYVFCIYVFFNCVHLWLTIRHRIISPQHRVALIGQPVNWWHLVLTFFTHLKIAISHSWPTDVVHMEMQTSMKPMLQRWTVCPYLSCLSWSYFPTHSHTLSHIVTHPYSSVWSLSQERQKVQSFCPCVRECNGLTEGCDRQDQRDHDGDPGHPQGFLPVALSLVGLQASAALQEACRQEVNPPTWGPCNPFRIPLWSL